MRYSFRLRSVLPVTCGLRCQFPSEYFLQNGLAEAGGALEVGGHHRFQLLHHAHPPLHFRHNPSLLGEGWEWNSKGSDGLRVEMDERNPDFAGRDVALGE